jgi:hypothetical protein
VTSTRSSAGRLLALGLTAGLALTACASPDRPSIQAPEVALPTPMASFGVSVAATLRALEAAVGGAGERLELPLSPYRPSEPEALLQVPRVIRRAALAGPDDGYVVIYEAPSAAEASRLAGELAGYLGSGFGQTNFVADSQFSVSTLGETIIFTTWSPRGAADAARAEAVFSAVSAVGAAVEVRK